MSGVNSNATDELRANALWPLDWSWTRNGNFAVYEGQLYAIEPSHDLTDPYTGFPFVRLVPPSLSEETK